MNEKAFAALLRRTQEAVAKELIYLAISGVRGVFAYAGVTGEIPIDSKNDTRWNNVLEKIIYGQESTATNEDKDRKESTAKDQDKEFLKCKESLQQMFQGEQIDEEVDHLWKYHVESYNQRKPRMKEAYQEITECKKLFQEFTVGEKCGRFVEKLQTFNGPRKMVAVALIDIMVRLLTEFGRDLKDIEDIIKDYKEIKYLLAFVDCPENIAIDLMDMFDTCNFEAFEMSLEAYKQIRQIEKQIEHPRGDARQTPTCQHLLYFPKTKRKMIS
ncbi:hypothetical protein SUGI_0094170 [Cryptomeria japonica]|nr:hypothetical protein SUGI_0094170 [Cryptomeria japonica]